MTNAAGSGNTSVTLTGGTSSGTIDLSASTSGALTINTSASSGNFTLKGAGGADTITAGSGTNTITAGAGGDKVTFGAHTGVDAVIYSAASQTYSALTAATIVSGTTALTGIDTYTGLKAGDTISIAAISNTFTGNVGSTITAATGTTTSLVRGNFNTTTNVWTTSSTGSDTLFVYDQDAAGAGNGTAVEAVAIIGYVATGTSAVAAGVLTLSA